MKDFTDDFVSVLTQTFSDYEPNKRKLIASNDLKSIGGMLDFLGGTPLAYVSFFMSFIPLGDEPSNQDLMNKLSEISNQIDNLHKYVQSAFAETLNFINENEFKSYWRKRVDDLQIMKNRYGDFLEYPDSYRKTFFNDVCHSDYQPYDIFQELFSTSCPDDDCTIYVDGEVEINRPSFTDYRNYAFTFYDKNYMQDDAYQMVSRFAEPIIMGMYESFLLHMTCGIKQYDDKGNLKDITCEDQLWVKFLREAKAMLIAIKAVYESYIDLANKLQTCYKKEVRLRHHSFSFNTWHDHDDHPEVQIQLNEQNYLPTKKEHCNMIFTRTCPYPWFTCYYCEPYYRTKGWARNTCDIKDKIGECLNHDLPATTPWVTMNQNSLFARPTYKNGDLRFHFIDAAPRKRNKFEMARLSYDEWNDPYRCDTYWKTKQATPKSGLSEDNDKIRVEIRSIQRK
jgi:hypothetical protein